MELAYIGENYATYFMPVWYENLYAW